jgi:hypothetical protein
VPRTAHEHSGDDQRAGQPDERADAADDEGADEQADVSEADDEGRRGARPASRRWNRPRFAATALTGPFPLPTLMSTSAFFNGQFGSASMDVDSRSRLWDGERHA